MSEVLIDSFGRRHRSLRVSVIDRCNLRCQYCMPAEGLGCVSRSELLSFEEIVLAVDVAVSLGVDRIRITGGEPLLRRDLSELIKRLKEQTSVAEIALTTNGILLERQAQALSAAGLDRVNISLDSLRPDRFAKITRHGLLQKVWRRVEAAVESGCSPLRINTLLLQGFNEDEVEDWLALVRKRRIDVRFMELMPIGEGAKLSRLGEFFNLTALRERLVEEKGLIPADVEVGNGPARYWKEPGAEGRLGFITPISNSYCNSCSRMRLTSVGELRGCLAVDEHVDIREALQSGNRQAVLGGFRRAVDRKPAGHQWCDGTVTKTSMSALGG